MPLELEPLPWERNALAPHISEETIDYHYGKHHKSYVDKLIPMVQGTSNEGKSFYDLMMTCDGGIFNCAAQTWNHTFYWHSLAKPGAQGVGGSPVGDIANKIDADFGSFEKFKEEFSAAAAGHFGSGWAWLVQDYQTGKLKIAQTHDAGNPMREKTGKPILTCDVWEHAYYIDYRNARPDYIKAWWNLVNWNFANSNLEVPAPKQPTGAFGCC